MCEHLIVVCEYLEGMGAPFVWKGRAWTDNCREWIYYNCVFDPHVMKQRLQLADHVVVHDYNDAKGGSERGLFCLCCLDAVMGKHPARIDGDTITIEL